MVSARLVVLVSGGGTNLGAILDAIDAGRLAATVVAVGADRAEAGGITRAREAGIDTFVVDPKAHGSRSEWNQQLADALDRYRPDWIVSAGFMRIIGEPALTTYAGRIVNTHPALLPAFPGAHAVGDALAYGIAVTGCTVHFVDAGVDTGPILAQAVVDVAPDDDEATLHERIKGVERPLLVAVLQALVAESSNEPPSATDVRRQLSASRQVTT